MGRTRFRHSGDWKQGVIEAAMENGWTLTAKCGERFVPAAAGIDAERFYLCPDCHDLRFRDTRELPHYVYRCYDAQNRLLYVGCSVWPPQRLEQHRQTAWWWPQYAYSRNLVFPTRDFALLKEREAIWSEKPRCNVRGRWLKGDPRSDWSLEDYIDFRHAVAETATVIGVRTERLLNDIHSEAEQRFGVAVLPSASRASA